MSRFRLRFLLQEFDLPAGEIIIGRSPECHITIEDPLISRQHTKIRVVGDIATLLDLGSRNGTRLNGRLINAPTRLTDADRIRIGAQELVFFQVGTDQRAPRQTGAMMFCANCGTPFPEGAAACPHCGHVHTAIREDETMSGLHVEPRRTWMLQLFGEVLERALTTGRVDEAERILRRAVDEFNERSARGEATEARHLSQIGDYAVRLSALKSDPAWLLWTLDAYVRVDAIPASAVVERMGTLVGLPGVRERLREATAAWRMRPSGLSADDAAIVSRLESLGASAGN